MRPSYSRLTERDWAERIDAAYSLLAACRVCPRECGVNRLEGELGICKAGLDPVVASCAVHFGEEPPISGTRGSGTVFFSHCNMKCIYCQNYPISQLGVGRRMTTADLADRMLGLQDRGVHNINFVTPSHYIPQLIRAVAEAAAKGLYIPIVYNTSGYDSVEALRLLEGVVDIYLPDMRYIDDAVAVRLSSAPDYRAKDRAAIAEMFRQVGLLQVDADGVAERGLVIRHMILPGGLSGTAEAMRFVRDEISPDAHISLMGQYFPAYKAVGHEEIGQKTTDDEYDAAFSAMTAAGLENGWVQEREETEENYFAETN